MPPGFAKSHWQLFLVFEMGWVRLSGKNLGCEGPPVPMNPLQAMALQTLKDWLVWDGNF